MAFRNVIIPLPNPNRVIQSALALPFLSNTRFFFLTFEEAILFKPLAGAQFAAVACSSYGKK